MPSSHISNTDYHEWLSDMRRDIGSSDPNKDYQLVVVPRGTGGWEIRVTKWSSCLPNDLHIAPPLEADSDDDLPVVLRRLYDWLKEREDSDPPLAD